MGVCVLKKSKINNHFEEFLKIKHKKIENFLKTTLLGFEIF
jgi:hypothetical protein